MWYNEVGDIMELVHVKGNTYYIKNATNIGVYKIDENSVYLIDTGNDSDAGKKILKLLEQESLKVVGIINTHSNADHVGGNKVIQDRTGCKILGYGIERSITENPLLEPSFLYGGYPFKELRNKFLCAKSSTVMDIDNNLPVGLEYFFVRGHFFDMIGVKTSDDVYFLGDSLFSEETITKYHLFFLYDVRDFLNTLDYLSTLKGELFIPSHVEATRDITSLIEMNKKKIGEVLEVIMDSCMKNTFEEILKNVFDYYHLMMNANQYVLIGSTVKSYLSYLYEEGKIKYEFVENKMLWEKI